MLPTDACFVQLLQLGVIFKGLSKKTLRSDGLWLLIVLRYLFLSTQVFGNDAICPWTRNVPILFLTTFTEEGEFSMTVGIYDHTESG